MVYIPQYYSFNAFLLIQAEQGLHGLNIVLVAWNTKLSTDLTSLGSKDLENSPCVFLLLESGPWCSFLPLYFEYLL